MKYINLIYIYKRYKFDLYISIFKILYQIKKKLYEKMSILYINFKAN